VKQLNIYGALIGSIALALPAMAQEDETPMLDRGTKEFGVAGQIDIPELDELDYDLDGSYGYFFRDGWEAGIELSAADFGGEDRLEITGFTEYNFRREQRWVPFVGGGLGLIAVDFDEDVTVTTPVDDEDGLLFDVEGGVKYFLRPYMALSVSIDFKFATEDVFATDDEIEDNLSSIRLGMRYYF
jgi:hypothetical protein